MLQQSNLYKLFQDPSSQLDQWELRDLAFIHTRVMNNGLFKIDPDQESLTLIDKQFRVITSLDNEEVKIALLNLSSKFWSNFSMRQIIYIASMIGCYPKQDINLKPLEPILNKNGFYVLKLLSEYDYYSWDCLRNTIAITGLAGGKSYGTPQLNSLKYSTKLATRQYPVINQNLNSYISSVIVNLALHEYQPIEDQVFTYSEIKSELIVGDIVYVLPLNWGYDSYEESYMHRALEFSIEFLKSFIAEMTVLGARQIEDIEIEIFLSTLKEEFENYSTLNYTFTKSQKDSIFSGVKNLFANISKRITTLVELNQLLESLTGLFEQYEQNLESKSIPFAYEFQANKFFYPSRANFHVFTIVDKVNQDLKSIQIDGKNPLKPLTIEDPAISTRAIDKVVVFRRFSNE